jgi:hypothetical protein
MRIPASEIYRDLGFVTDGVLRRADELKRRRMGRA